MIIIQLTPDQLETIIHKAIKNAMFEGPDRDVSPKSVLIRDIMVNSV